MTVTAPRRSTATSPRPPTAARSSRSSPPATYTVSLGAVGYVDRQGNASPSQVTGVTSGATSSVAFDYDQAATLTLTMTPAGRRLVPVERAGRASATPRSLPTGSKVFTGTGAIRTVGNLFPYADGYAAWAGELRRRGPGGQGRQRARLLGRRDPRRPSSQTDPGGTASRDREPADGRAATTATSRRRAARATSSRCTTPDNGCPTGLQYTVGDVQRPGQRRSSRCRTAPGRSRSRARPPYGGSWPTVTLDPRVTGEPRRERGLAVTAARSSGPARGGTGERGPDDVRARRGRR